MRAAAGGNKAAADLGPGELNLQRLHRADAKWHLRRQRSALRSEILATAPAQADRIPAVHGPAAQLLQHQGSLAEVDL